MSKKIPLSAFIITVIVLSSTILIYKTKADTLQRKIDNAFRTSLGDSHFGFAYNYNTMNENDKIFQYITMASDLKIARNLALISSYNQKNPFLEYCLNDLYFCITDGSSRELILDKEDIIYKRLCDISNNPDDKEKAKELFNIVNSIYSRKR